MNFIYHPSIIYTTLGVEWVPKLILQLTLVERRGTPYTGWQSITGLTHRDKQPFTCSCLKLQMSQIRTFTHL